MFGFSGHLEISTMSSNQNSSPGSSLIPVVRAEVVFIPPKLHPSSPYIFHIVEVTPTCSSALDTTNVLAINFASRNSAHILFIVKR